MAAKDPFSNRYLNFYLALLILTWSGLVAGSLFLHANTHREEVVSAAYSEAQACYNKDILFRRWVASHGGVYVPVSDKTPPNSYLSNIPDRDITTPSGRPLTLINPAYMTRQVYELGKMDFGILGHITSLKPIRPENSPDPWEIKALQSFEQGFVEKCEIQEMNGERYLRLMRPLLTEESCLKCHASQGYKEGNIRGGISVSIPMHTYDSIIQNHIQQALMSHGMFWTLGIGGILYAGRRIKRRVYERNQAEEALRSRQNKLNSIFRAAPTGIGCVVNRVLTEVNDRICEMTGYSEDELLGKSARILYPTDEDYEYVGTEKYRQISEHGTGTVETFWKRKDGSVINVLLSSTPINTEDLIQGVTFTALDITERKRAEKALLEKTEEIDKHFSAAPDLLCIATTDGYFRRLNPAWEKTLGYNREELTASPFMDFVHPEDLERTRDAMASLLDKKPVVDFVNRFRCKDGSYRWIEWRAYPANDFIYSAARDITERKRAEEERRALDTKVQQTQKLESLGVLAGGIAHDFNNLLMGILGNTDIALADLPPESPVRTNIQDIGDASRRAADLCRQMLAYSGKGRFMVEPIDVTRIVREMTHMLEVSISKKASLRYDMTEDIPAIEADATQIRQVVMNLIINASEALEDKNGVISISTGVKDYTEKLLNNNYIGEKLPPGRYVYIEVADTGCGMPPETVKKIFDPFFTTKFTGRGLGLAAVLGIVRGHKGAISVESTPGRGTTFTVSFPASNRSASIPGQATETSAWKGSGTVLVVDDEEIVLSIACRMIERYGFSVLTASHGREALEIYKQHKNDIACVLLDLTMPQMDGEETFMELRRLSPDVRVIMSSGYNEQEVTQRFTGQGLAGFIQKPYQLHEMAEVLRKAIEGA